MRRLKAIFLLLICLGVAHSQRFSTAVVAFYFPYYPEEAVTELTEKMNSVKSFAVRQKVCDDFHKLHSHGFWNEYIKTIERENRFVVNEEETIQMCEQLIKQERVEKTMADRLFALLAKKNIVSVYKATEIRPERRRKVGEAIWDAYDYVRTHMEDNGRGLMHS